MAVVVDLSFFRAGFCLRRYVSVLNYLRQLGCAGCWLAVLISGPVADRPTKPRLKLLPAVKKRNNRM
jgi:hypothetical protein